MVTLTKAQRAALKNVYDRTPIYHTERVNFVELKVRSTYRDFRRTVQPTFGMDGAVVVPWCNMWLAIETDGHVHS